MAEFFTRQRHVVGLALLTLFLSFGSFFMDGDVSLNLSDEGYLWYGVRAVNAGQVPIRDFQAYDPGRYYWAAGFSYFFGEDLVALRAGCVLFQCLGILAGLLAARRLSRDWKFLLPVALIFVMWMIPRYKVFEQSIALIAIYAAVRLVERPTLRQHFVTGIFVGLMAFIGRNHGLYQLAGFGLAILLLARGAWSALPKRMGMWGAGIAVGYLPQLAMVAFVPGYFAAFLALLDRNVTIGSNVALPVPWPWLLPKEYDPIMASNWFAEGFFYCGIVALIAFAAIRLPFLTREKLQGNAVFVAAACMVPPYAHHTFSRADYVHLAHSAPGLSIAILAVCFMVRPGVQRWLPMSAAGALVLISALATWMHMPLFAEALSPAGAFVEMKVAGRTMHVAKDIASVVMIGEKLAGAMAKPDEPILFAPHWPGLYAVTNRLSPVQHLYFTRPTPNLDSRTVAEMKKSGVKWVMLQDYALDGRDELRFKNTNPLMCAYLRESFDRVAVPGLPPNSLILRLREPAGSPAFSGTRSVPADSGAIPTLAQ